MNGLRWNVPEKKLNPKTSEEHTVDCMAGPLKQEKESHSGFKGIQWLQDLFQDLRYGLRSLLHSPGFTVVALLTLGLGIGITTVMFTIANGVLLKPLPFKNPERLVSLKELVGNKEWRLSYPSFLDIKSRSRTLESVAAWRYGGGVVSAPGAAEYVKGRQITDGLFALLGIHLPYGREFSESENLPNQAPVAIIGHELWRNRYQGNPDAVGQQLVLEGKSYTVIGIAPEDFRLDGNVDVFVPLGQNNDVSMQSREMHMHTLVYARLRPEASMKAAQDELSVLGRTLAQYYPKANSDLDFKAASLQSEMVGGIQSRLWLLLGAVMLVLLISCANLAGLLLVRAAAREKEVAMRVALGAGRGRLIRQCLTESTLISLLGGALGVSLASIGIQPFLVLWPGGLPRSEEIQLDSHVLLFALVISLLCSLLFGLAPAWRAPKQALEQALRAGTRTTGDARRLHGACVAAEIAITIVLLVSAGMLGKCLIKFSQLDLGINEQNVMTAGINFPSTLKADPMKIRASCRTIIDSVKQIPGVEAAGVTDIIPMIGSASMIGYWTGTAEPSPDVIPLSLLYVTFPDHLKVMGIRLLQGRFFTEQDRPGAEPVIVINELLANHIFPGQSAIGHRISLQVIGPVRIIGVVGQVQHWGLANNDNPLKEQIYFPFDQLPDEYVVSESKNLSLILRTSVPPQNLMDLVQRQIRRLANDQALYRIRTMETIVGESLAQYRFLMILFGIFAGLALLLAGIGIYGVISYMTRRRMQEFGIRMALGANAIDVVRLALKQSLWMICGGVIVGSLASILAGRSLTKLIGVPADDPLTFASMVALLVAVAFIAGFIPSRRAGSADPAVVLRQE